MILVIWTGSVDTAFMKTTFDEVASALYGSEAEFAMNLRTLCEVAGHCGSPDMTEYLDGVFVTFCRACGDKLIFEQVPGEFPKLKLKAFLLGQMAEEPLNLETLLEIQNALRIERAQLEFAESQLRLVKDMVKSRCLNRQ